LTRLAFFVVIVMLLPVVSLNFFLATSSVSLTLSLKRKKNAKQKSVFLSAKMQVDFF